MIQGLKYEITIPGNTNNNYTRLDECIILVFGESNELDNTEIEIHDNYINIREISADTNQIEMDRIGSGVSSNCGTVDKIALREIFKQGRLKMTEIKMPMPRERKQKS